MMNEYIAGESIPLEFEFLKENREPLDLTLFTARFKMCPMGEEDVVVIDKEGELDDVPTTGRFYIDLLPSETIDLEEGYYTFQASVSQGETVRQVLENTLFIKGAI